MSLENSSAFKAYVRLEELRSRFEADVDSPREFSSEAEADAHYEAMLDAYIKSVYDVLVTE